MGVTTNKQLWIFLAAMVAGFALIGLNFILALFGPVAIAVGTVLFIIGVIVVIVFALAIIVKALKALFRKDPKGY